MLNQGRELSGRRSHATALAIQSGLLARSSKKRGSSEPARALQKWSPPGALTTRGGLQEDKRFGEKKGEPSSLPLPSQRDTRFPRLHFWKSSQIEDCVGKMIAPRIFYPYSRSRTCWETRQVFLQASRPRRGKKPMGFFPLAGLSASVSFSILWGQRGFAPLQSRIRAFPPPPALH